MAKILIKTPNEKNNEWRQCELLTVYVNTFKDTGKITVKGIAENNCMKTSIYLTGIKELMTGGEIYSLHKYFKVKLPADDIETKDLFNQMFIIKP